MAVQPLQDRGLGYVVTVEYPPCAVEVQAVRETQLAPAVLGHPGSPQQRGPRAVGPVDTDHHRCRSQVVPIICTLSGHGEFLSSRADSDRDCVRIRTPLS